MGKNPIEKRLERLSDQWLAFACAPHARLLCWRLAPSERRMADAFFACENDERIAEHLDLFVPLNTPFTDPQQYGIALSAALADGYEEGREALLEAGGDAGWHPPRRGAREADLPFLIRTCTSLHAHHALPGKLVLVLRPRSIAKVPAHRDWLRAFAAAAPAWLRAIVLEDPDHSVYAELLDPPSRAIAAVSAELDMPGALQELSNAAGELDTPGGQFRDLFLQLTNRLGKGDIATALQLGARALELVAQHELRPLGVAIHFALGAGLLAAGRNEEAVARYEAAEAAAIADERDGSPETRAACRTLRLQVRLACVSALLAGEAYARAAQHCEETAPLARALGDQRAELDCRRLAGFAWERAGQRDAALRAGCLGLDVVRAMDEQTRAMSSFEYLAKDLLALTAGAAHADGCEHLERELAALRPPPAAAYSAAGRTQGSKGVVPSSAP